MKLLRVHDLERASCYAELTQLFIFNVSLRVVTYTRILYFLITGKPSEDMMMNYGVDQGREVEKQHDYMLSLIKKKKKR